MFSLLVLTQCTNVTDGTTARVALAVCWLCCMQSRGKNYYVHTKLTLFLSELDLILWSNSRFVVDETPIVSAFHWLSVFTIKYTTRIGFILQVYKFDAFFLKASCSSLAVLELWLSVTGSALSVVGPSLLQVRQSGTRHRTVSVTRRSAATVLDNRWRRICFVVTTQHTQRSRDASWLCAILLTLILTLTFQQVRSDPATHSLQIIIMVIKPTMSNAP